MNTYGTKVSVRISQTFQSNRESHIAWAHNVLDLEVCEFAREAQLLNNSCIFACGKFGIILRFGTCHHHFARCKDQRSSLGLTDTHDHSSKALKQCSWPEALADHLQYIKYPPHVYLWVVFGVTSMECNSFEIKSTVQIDSCHNVSAKRKQIVSKKIYAWNAPHSAYTLITQQTIYLLQNRGDASHGVRVLIFVTRCGCIDGCWCRWQSKWRSRILHWSWYGWCLHSRCGYGRCGNVETGHVLYKEVWRKGRSACGKEILNQWAPPFYTFLVAWFYPAMMITIYGPFHGLAQLPPPLTTFCERMEWDHTCIILAPS